MPREVRGDQPSRDHDRRAHESHPERRALAVPGHDPAKPWPVLSRDGSNVEDTRICDEFPMLMKIDCIRLDQNQGEDLGDDNYMQVDCDPKSHPTKEWINGHLNEYQDAENPSGRRRQDFLQSGRRLHRGGGD